MAKKSALSKALDKRKKKSAKKGPKQATPQSENYSSARDKKEKAKPAGYRFKGLDNFKTPTKKDIAADAGKPKRKRKTYFENRKDKSDKAPSEMFAKGGMLPVAYEKPFKLKGNGRREYHLSPTLTDSELKQAARQLFPTFDYNGHLSAAKKYSNKAKNALKEYNDTVDKKFMEEFGRKPEATDYKVSGIWTDEFSSAAKDEIRSKLSEYNAYRSAFDLHNAMLKKADKIDLKKFEFGGTTNKMLPEKFVTGGEIKSIRTKADAMISQFNNKIKSKESIENFINDIYFKLGLNFHPDNPFKDYIDADGKQVFTKIQANKLDQIIEQTWDYADKHGIDIYEIALKYQQEWMSKSKEFAKGGVVKDIAFETSNLYLYGKGHDTNGNFVVKVGFPNERAFSIQTLGVLPHTNRIMHGVKNLSEITPADMALMETEINAYVSEHGSDKQKKKLKLYEKSETSNASESQSKADEVIAEFSGSVTSKDFVQRFANAVYHRLGIYNPFSEDSFGDYTDENDKPKFTPNQAKELDAIRDRVMDYISDNKLNIQEILDEMGESEYELGGSINAHSGDSAITIQNEMFGDGGINKTEYDVTDSRLQEFEYSKSSAATFGNQKWVNRIPKQVTNEDLSFIPEQGIRSKRYSKVLIYGFDNLDKDQKRFIVRGLKDGKLKIFEDIKTDEYVIKHHTEKHELGGSVNAHSGDSAITIQNEMFAKGGITQEQLSKLDTGDKIRWKPDPLEDFEYEGIIDEVDEFMSPSEGKKIKTFGVAFRDYNGKKKHTWVTGRSIIKIFEQGGPVLPEDGTQADVMEKGGQIEYKTDSLVMKALVSKEPLWRLNVYSENDTRLFGTITTMQGRYLCSIDKKFPHVESFFKEYGTLMAAAPQLTFYLRDIMHAIMLVYPRFGKYILFEDAKSLLEGLGFESYFEEGGEVPEDIIKLKDEIEKGNAEIEVKLETTQKATIPNVESAAYAENLIEFMGTNLEGKLLPNGDYVVLSFLFYPIWFYCTKDQKWYGNSDKYNSVTAMHMSSSRPTPDAEMLPVMQLFDKMNQGIQSYDLGGVLVRQLYPMSFDNAIAHQ